MLVRRTHSDAGQPVSSANALIAASLCLIAAALVAQTACQLADFLVFNLHLRALDSDHHASVFGAISLVAQAIAAAAIIARAARPSPARPLWLSLGGLVAALLVLRTFVGYEPSLLVPPLALVFVLLSGLTLRDPPAVRAIVGGALLLLVCSFVLHSVGPDIDGASLNPDTWSYQLTTIVKHGAELAGWLLLATGMAAATPQTLTLRVIWLND